MSILTGKRRAKGSTSTLPPLSELHTRLERIPAGQPLLLRLPSGVHKQVTLKAGTTVSLGKYGCFRASDLIGLPFGHTFEIVGGSTGGNDKRAAQKRVKEMERANEKRKLKGEEEKVIPSELVDTSEGDDKAGELRIVVEAPPAEIGELRAGEQVVRGSKCGREAELAHTTCILFTLQKLPMLRMKTLAI